MFHSLRGTITPVAPQRATLSTPYGIEWSLLCSTRAIAHWRTQAGEQVVYTHMIFREDLIRLYGYYCELERELFLRLITVNGIGPAVAIQILSTMSIDVIQQAIEQGDHAPLTSVPKIGLKSAQKIILALKGSITPHTAAPSDELISALLAMGYDQERVANAVADLRATVSRAAFTSTAAYEERLFREAIARLR